MSGVRSLFGSATPTGGDDAPDPGPQVGRVLGLVRASARSPPARLPHRMPLGQRHTVIDRRRRQADEDIFLAAKLGNLDLATRLLAERAAVAREREDDGTTPVHWAALNNHVQVLRTLLDHGALCVRVTVVGARWAAGWRPLVRAALVQSTLKFDRPANRACAVRAAPLSRRRWHSLFILIFFG